MLDLIVMDQILSHPQQLLENHHIFVTECRPKPRKGVSVSSYCGLQHLLRFNNFHLNTRLFQSDGIPGFLELKNLQSVKTFLFIHRQRHDRSNWPI